MFRRKPPSATLLFNFRATPKSRQRFSPSYPTSQTPFLDPAIWCNLPAHVLDHILSFLPLKTFLTLRSSCKHFRTLIFSPVFLSKHTSPVVTPFLLLSHPQCPASLALYSPQLNAWRNLPITSSDRRTLLASSKGLLCFSVHGFFPSSILVVNLLTGSARKVKAPIYPLHLDHITLITSASGYKIFTLCSSSSARRAYLYDSGNRSWTRFEGSPLLLADGVYNKGSLYFTSPDPFRVVCFDLKSGKWENRIHENSGLPGDITFARLVSNPEEGTLYLVGGLGQNGISRSVKMWRLCERNQRWVEEEWLPDAFCRKLMSVCYHNYEHVYCLWHEGLVCVCCYSWPEILCYNVLKRLWLWLPKCPSLPEKWSCGFRWFSFFPHLHASA